MRHRQNVKSVPRGRGLRAVALLTGRMNRSTKDGFAIGPRFSVPRFCAACPIYESPIIIIFRVFVFQSFWPFYQRKTTGTFFAKTTELIFALILHQPTEFLRPRNHASTPDPRGLSG